MKKAISLVLSVTILLSLFAFAAPSFSGAASQYVSSSVPNVYKSYIAELKKLHPNWNFEFFYTGLNWDSVLNGEMRDGTSLISYYYYPKSYRAIDSNSYNSSTDNYIQKDAGGWYNASREAIAYFMDPRNFLNEKNVFQFEKLSFDSSIHNIDGVKAILAGSFMDGKKIKNTSNEDVLYAQAYMDAAKTSKVSPYHLAARTIQEVGKGGSGSTSGTYSGYEGYYNFYNIGATQGSNPIANGLKWAKQSPADEEYRYMRPWNSQYKSIVGGAIYIGKGYINNGQNTLYLEKFDVVGEYNDTSLYSHQYMGNLTAAYSEGNEVYSAYVSLGVIENNFTFLIPVYNSMPSDASPKPINADSPWSWLKSLTVEGYSIKPSSTLQVATNNFYVTVPNNVSSVNVSATPYNSGATVTGLPNSTTTTVLDTGKVTGVDSSLRVRTSAGVSSPDSNANRLKYNGEYVNLSNGTAIKKLGEQTVSGTVWFNISFSYSETTLSGWVSSDYITMDTATVSNYGKVSLKDGDNVVNITVTAKSGAKRVYVLTITRQKKDSTDPPSPPPTPQSILNTNYKIDEKNKIIYTVANGTKYDTFIKNLGVSSGVSVTVKDGSSAFSSGAMKTGLTLTAVSAGITYTYTVAVTGDVNCDGEVSIFDIIKIRNHILGSATLSGAAFLAADINGDAELNIFDIVKTRNIILG